MLLLIEEMLLDSLPLWVSIASFVAGWCCGWFMRGWYSAKGKGGAAGVEAVIQITVFLLWTVATGRAVLLDVPYPPFFLNIFFGAIVGSMNRGLGEYLINLARAFSPPKQ